MRPAMGFTELRRLSATRHRDERLFEFASSGAKDDVSMPWPAQLDSGELGVVMYRIEEKVEGIPAQSFADVDLQERLAKHLLELLDERRERVALRRIANSAYIWPRDGWTAQAPPQVLREVELAP